MHARRILLLGVSLAAIAPLAACGSSSSGSSGGGTNGSSASSQVIHVAVDSLPAAKGNPFDSTGSPGIYTYAAIYDPVTYVNSSGQVEPWLATSWQNTSPTTWTFTLRSGVKFSDGETLDAQGLADVINYMKKNADLSKSAVAGDLLNIASAKALTAMTVQVTTTAPDPILPAKLTELYVPAPKVLTQQGVQAITNNPVGTGPFEVKSWGTSSITMTAFTGSWRAPKIGGLDIQALPDPAARLQALQSGQVDLVDGVSPDQVSNLGSGYQADITKAAQVMSLAFINTAGKSPLSDPRVRQALNYAVDKNALANNLLLGKGEAMGQGTTPGAVGNNPSVQPYPYDPAKAKQLLAAAGYPSGFSMTADVVVGSFPADGDIYQQMAANLGNIGVKVKLQQVTFTEWLNNYLANNWGSAQAFGLSWNALPTMDGSRAMSLFSCLKQPAFFCDKPTATLLTKAMSDMNATSRAQEMAQVSAAMHDNPPALYLVREIDINAMSSKLSGFVDDNRFFPYNKMFMNQAG